MYFRLIWQSYDDRKMSVHELIDQSVLCTNTQLADSAATAVWDGRLKTEQVVQ